VLGLLAPAFALDLVVRANLSGDLRTVHGTVEAHDAGETSPRWIDPLARLTVPHDGRTRLWTLPAGPQPAQVAWTRDEHGAIAFVATLPRRNGDVGWSPDDGLRANGGWYPVPVDADGRPMRARWDVTIVGPGVIVLNGAVASPEPVLARVRWTGESDRLALAALPEASAYRTTTILPFPPTEALTLVSRGTPPARVLAGLREASPAGDQADPVVVVIGHDDGRLAHAGPGVVYLSRRAFRTWPASRLPRTDGEASGTRRWHVTAVRRARLSAGCTTCRDGAARDTLAALATPDGARTRAALRPHGLGPLVDAVLSDPAIPAWADLRDRPWSREPDLGERLGGMHPAEAVARQLAALGPRIAQRVAAALRAGAPLAQAAQDEGVPADLVTAWWSPPAVATLRADRTDAGTQVRWDAGGAQAATVVPLVVDGTPRPWVVRGTAATLELPGARRVRVDPDGIVAQDDRDDDRLPRVWSATVAGGLRSLDLDERTFDVALQATVRHAGSTRRALLVQAGHDARERLSGSVGALYGVGPLTRPNERAWRAAWTGGFAWLDEVPATQDPVAALGSVSLTRDTLGDRFLPLGGSVLGVSTQAGRTPDGTTSWWQALATAGVVVVLHPRHALAARLRTGIADASEERRTLPLGGPRALRCVAQDAWFGESRATASAEWRIRALRDASLPLGAAWLTEVHVTPGLEAGWGRRDHADVGVIGAMAGVHTSLDLAGLFPVRGGFTMAWPITSRGIDASRPQLTFEVDHGF
jgi:hypothetical protein